MAVEQEGDLAVADEPTCEVCDVFGVVRRADVLLDDRMWLCWPHHNQELWERDMTVIRREWSEDQ